MKIAVFSPLNPVKTGISDYTEEMLFELGKHFAIDLYIPSVYIPENKNVRRQFRVTPYDPSVFDPSQYDEILYHMGNNYEAHGYIRDALQRHAGIVVLHDYVLQGFYAERYAATGDFSEYSQLLVKYYAEKGEAIAENIARPMTLPIWESAEAFDYPLNEEILESAKAIIVHSNFIKEKVQAKTHKPVVKINSHGYDLKTSDRNSLREQMGIQEGGILISSIGFINKNKRFDVILSALEELGNPAVTFVIAGQDRGNLLNNYLDNRGLNIVVKGHLPIEELQDLLQASDICINLRYPTMGENSGSLLRMMGYGKPVLVTNFGSYADFPDHTVLKVNPDIDEKELIKRFVAALIEDEDFRLSLGREANQYIQEECSIERCVFQYASFIKEQAVQGPLEVKQKGD